MKNRFFQIVMVEDVRLFERDCDFGCLATVNSRSKYLCLLFNLEEYDYRKLNYEENNDII